MTSRPIVRKTYGRSTRLGESSSSSSILFTPALDAFSSSPPPSSSLITPPSSPTRVRENVRSSPVPDGESDLIVAAPHRPSKVVQCTLQSFFAQPPKRKPLGERTTIPPSPKKPSTKSSLTQLHLTHLPLLHSCKECGMSFVRGSEDEHLHAKHHARVIRGIPWDGLGKGKGKMIGDGGWKVVRDDVYFGEKSAGKGRVIMCDGSWGGQKLEDIFFMVDTVLDAPRLEDSMLERCKIFLLVTSSPPPTIKRSRLVPGSKPKLIERIVGIVVAQPIKTAMRVVSVSDTSGRAVDSGGGVMCDPTPLDTPLGIHRLFTIPSYRSLGLARILLDASCQHTIYGCSFDPRKGEVAFSQPTESGKKTMERWGRGGVRVFIDDQRQL